jgi:hypothetical protein
VCQSTLTIFCTDASLEVLPLASAIWEGRNFSTLLRQWHEREPGVQTSSGQKTYVVRQAVAKKAGPPECFSNLRFASRTRTHVLRMHNAHNYCVMCKHVVGM